MFQVLALLAATAFAVGSVLQQRGAMQTEGNQTQFLVGLWRHPVWVAGGLMQMLGWLLQAVALNKGSLVVVQALTTLSIVIALPLGAWLTEQRVTPAVWLAALAVVAGIVAFLFVGSPSGSDAVPAAHEWWLAGLSTLALVVALAAAARGRSPGMQAALCGSAAGLAFGLQAAVTKVFTETIGGGVQAILRSWQPYVLIATALVGFALQQTALRTGALAAALASSNAMTLLASVVLGLTVFDESLHLENGRSVVVLGGLAAAVIGIVVLARSPAVDAHDGSPNSTQSLSEFNASQ
jgi:drug/metabolite transporter (DMT)-like permease